MSVGCSVLADPKAIIGEIQLKNSNDQNPAVASGVTAGSSNDRGAGGGGCLGLTNGSEWRLPSVLHYPASMIDSPPGNSIWPSSNILKHLFATLLLDHQHHFSLLSILVNFDHSPLLVLLILVMLHCLFVRRGCTITVVIIHLRGRSRDLCIGRRGISDRSRTA
jgi:hypothetical protein